MRALQRGTITLVFGSLIAACSLLSSTPAYASLEKHHSSHGGHSAGGSKHADAASHTHMGGKHALSKSGKVRYARGGGGGISCVPFARMATGIALKGNAANWWDAASGVYERGSRPETGSVLNFRATGHMRLGHVAVVTNVIGEREIEIDHANWWGPGAGKGGIARGIRVEDVSASNDWSAVRVALGHSEDYGSVYPTYGFIYDRPDSGTMVANAKTGGPVADRAGLDEVAEAPAASAPLPNSLPVDAPDRALR